MDALGESGRRWTREWMIIMNIFIVYRYENFRNKLKSLIFETVKA